MRTHVEEQQIRETKQLQLQMEIRHAFYNLTERRADTCGGIYTGQLRANYLI